ncbi:hypothetical protein KM427_15905 [Nocardioides sp. LMS-CY]|uniref:hypothetical protein n=1 Tax=Nocardioides sp. (strain LMS-CY) TaxID=2840457 RepID=UPI001C008D51|nr:hypothetical protein [Nocardioides sp. LMS-CY]QWF20466.1 hypothetical protein KM427_15905 [Nocardioides sp. LMS-CY]
MPKKIDAASKERALRMFADHRSDYPSDTALAQAVATKLGIGRETADGGWSRRTSMLVPDPVRQVMSRPRSNGSKAELKKLREDDEILKAGGCRTNVRRGSGPGEIAPGRAWGLAPQASR